MDRVRDDVNATVCALEETLALLVPDIAGLTMRAMREDHERGDERAEESANVSLEELGIASRNYRLTIELPVGSGSEDTRDGRRRLPFVEETADNAILFEQLRESYSYMLSEYFDAVRRWVDLAVKVYEQPETVQSATAMTGAIATVQQRTTFPFDPATIATTIRDNTELLQRMRSAKAKCEDLGVTEDAVARRSARVAYIDDDLDDEELIDVELEPLPESIAPVVDTRSKATARETPPRSKGRGKASSTVSANANIIVSHVSGGANAGIFEYAPAMEPAEMASGSSTKATLVLPLISATSASHNSVAPEPVPDHESKEGMMSRL